MLDVVLEKKRDHRFHCSGTRMYVFESRPSKICSRSTDPFDRNKNVFPSTVLCAATSTEKISSSSTRDFDAAVSTTLEEGGTFPFPLLCFVRGLSKTSFHHRSYASSSFLFSQPHTILTSKNIYNHEDRRCPCPCHLVSEPYYVGSLKYGHMLKFDIRTLGKIG